MWGQTPEEMFRRRAGLDAAPADLHRPLDGDDNVWPPSTADTSPNGGSISDDAGTWGERDVGGHVNQRMAMEDFAEMRREISNLTEARSQPSAKGGNLDRSVSKRATSRSGRRSSVSTIDVGHDKEISIPKDDFQLEQFMREGHFEKRTEEGESTKKLGVIFKNLTVLGVGSKATLVRTLPDAVLGTFGPDLYRILSKFVPVLRAGAKSQTRELIRDFTGVVRPGEMLLVLGRPGSGCSTFLKAIANNRGSFASVNGDVSYSGMSARHQDKFYRGEVVYNPEDDLHLPSLSVWQTLKFSLLNKTKKREKAEINIILEAFLKMFAISHTRRTVIGDEFIRGISGGERKRVSIAETLSTKNSVACWDGSTRGLDSSTALDYARSLRIMTDVSARTTITTLYQAGEEIYQLVDKVLVIEDGRMIFQGSAKDARQYFVSLGFYAPPRQTTPDFLTSVGDPNEREFRRGYEAQCPKTTEELEAAFRKSDYYKKVLDEVADYERHLKGTDHVDTRIFKDSVRAQKSKTVAGKSSYTVSFWSQVLACTKREFWLIWGDKTSLYTKYFIIISNALIVGSLFYKQSPTTQSAFSRGGTAFFSIIFLGWLQLGELMKAVSGRTIIDRHKNYAFYRPSAVNLARLLTDFPMIFFQVIVFSVIIYFMTGLDLDASKFFIFLLFVYITTLCVTGLYRMFAALSPTLDDAVRFSGVALNLLVIFTGYVIPKPQLLMEKIWFGWLYYVTPLSYAFEGVLTNEFAGRVMPCAEQALVPQGPGVQSQYQGCAIDGAQLDSTLVRGESYLETTYSYTRANLWRNFGLLIVLTAAYLLVTVLATECLSFVEDDGGALTFKKTKKAKKQVAATVTRLDEEKGGQPVDSASSNNNLQRARTQDEALAELSKSESVFTWSNLKYSVPYHGGQKQLLNNVNGFAKPGVMVALVGASGAGKTTLLNTLSQRQKIGTVSGEMLVDGKALTTEFQRSTGFVEQMDLHDRTATVREALEFSAILRQDRKVSRQEKLDYVDKIIDLLELQEIQDAIIISLGVEQKKRLTIGVELAARPSLLLFLDEPTSGLDSQSAFSIVRFLKKLCRAGQAIVCTIHQPSSMLIQQFDMILALNPGGSTFYFGAVGEDGSAVRGYFAERGVDCPPNKNVAEFILETAAKGGKRKDNKRLDWNREWKESKENQNLLDEIKRINSTRSKIPASQTDTKHEFAAPVWEQTTMLTKRMFIQQWRDPSYIYGKLFVSVIVGIFNGFTFYNLGTSIQDTQNLMFTSFLILTIPPTLVNSVVPKFYKNRDLWEKRELPSRIYGWTAFCTANLVSEVPSALVSAVLYWLLWYLPTGLPTDASTAGYVFLMTLLFYVFQMSWGQWICAFAPSFTVISNVLPFFFVMFTLFNGVVVPYSQLDVFWKYWMYWVNPATYWIGGVLAATLRNASVRCAESEAAYFNPPPGMSCRGYAGEWVESVGVGYLVNPEASGACGYCAYKSGVEYMATLNVRPEDKWRDFGVFVGFCVANWALVYFFIYTVRIRGWSFGFGTLFGGLGKGVDVVKGLLSKKRRTRRRREPGGRDVEKA